VPHILLQTTASAVAGVIARAAQHGHSSTVRSMLASHARITEGEVDAISRGLELPEWAVVRDMAAGSGMAPTSFAFRALADMDGTEQVDDDDNPDTPSVTGYRFTMSTASEDRARDIVQQDWILDQFMRNPVAPWAHDYSQPVVGSWRSVQVAQGNLRGTLIPFATESYPLSMTVRAQLEAGVLRSCSVGFMPRQMLWRGDLDEDDPDYSARGGLVLMTPTLFECSPCPVPMNQEALRMRAAGVKSVEVGDEQNNNPDGLPWATSATLPSALPWA
jgi:phage head maturation protease